jgi:hypothetical protein
MIRRVLLLALLTIAAGAMLALRQVGPEPTGRGSDAYLAMLLDCSNGNPVANKEAALSVRICMGESADTAYAEGGIGDFADVLESAISENPWLRAACHPAAHMLTEERPFDRPALEELLREVGDVATCDWAFGHAAVSGLGLLGPSEFRRGEILEWCLANDDVQIILKNCIDGVGHHVWLATASVEESVLACEEVPAEMRMTCGGGVLMQMFEPATQKPTEYARDQAEDIIPGFCAEWRQHAKEQKTIETCAHGAGYVYGLDLRDAVFTEIRGLRSGSTFSATARERLANEVGKGVTRCEALGADISAACMQMFARSIPFDFARVDRAAYDALCEGFPVREVVTSCQSRQS